MDQIATEGRAAWPELNLDDGLFRGYLAERAGSASGAVTLTASPADLFLACACLHGVPGAVETFERANRRVLDAAVRKVDSSQAFADDVRQEVLAHLFVSREGKPPKIAQFKGQGQLSTWAYVTTMRIAKRLRQQSAVHGEKRQRAVREGLYEALTHEADPSLLNEKVRFARELEAAFYAAIDALPTRERLWLYMNVVENVPMDKLGTMSGVSQSAVSRHIASTKARLVAESKSYILEHLKLHESEYESLLRVVKSQVNITLSRIAGSKDEDGGDGSE